jgi:hypothetical protein
MNFAARTTLNPGTKAFYYHPTEAWIKGTITGTGSKSLMFLSDSNNEEYSAKESELHPVLDDATLEIIQDLLKLNELHEATLLQNIRSRYIQVDLFAIKVFDEVLGRDLYFRWSDCNCYQPIQKVAIVHRGTNLEIS